MLTRVGLRQLQKYVIGNLEIKRSNYLKYSCDVDNIYISNSAGIHYIFLGKENGKRIYKVSLELDYSSYGQ
jgi:hypothetical protein